MSNDWKGVPMNEETMFNYKVSQNKSAEDYMRLMMSKDGISAMAVCKKYKADLESLCEE